MNFLSFNSDLSFNYISGSIPSSFSQLPLVILSLSGNRLSGEIPNGIGEIGSLEELVLNANNFMGTIPETFGKLTNFTDFRIDGTAISGKLPGFIGNWSRLDRLDMQGTFMEGPIPVTISLLSNLTEPPQALKLSHSLPPLACPTRSPSCPASLPPRPVPPVVPAANQPSKIEVKKITTIICYHVATAVAVEESATAAVAVATAATVAIEESAVAAAAAATVAAVVAAVAVVVALAAVAVTAAVAAVAVADGRSQFSSISEEWGYSSTGVFMGEDDTPYRAQNTFSLNVTGVYETARVAPLSLRYYSLCFRKGSYKGKLESKDFNIVEEAQGVDIPIIKEFDDVLVSGSTMEIDFYWVGKRTTAIPVKGVYGPLISAIEVTPSNIISTIVGIVLASRVILVLILAFLWMKGYLGKKDLEDKELRSLDLQTGYFTLRHIKVATGIFHPANKIGEGGFGPVCKLSSKSKQGKREFVIEIGMIFALQHPNLVRLYGCCIEGNQLLLIYEYMENNSLACALFGREEHQLHLDWPTRRKICLGMAKGLAYLHEESRLKIVHRDIKATNVLLDKDLNAKISDFGLAKLDEEEKTHIST
ncbi:hypothetical protein SO802_015101 [Lithocarpus litseifolius]|uniref:non-specific serine/threonine protein kinase n=1 Tax=Lithocarpus litseifolius TaxID=425828 RepID=A0AAW2CSS6_9ROSI